MWAVGVQCQLLPFICIGGLCETCFLTYSLRSNLSTSAPWAALLLPVWNLPPSEMPPPVATNTLLAKVKYCAELVVRKHSKKGQKTLLGNSMLIGEGEKWTRCADSANFKEEGGGKRSLTDPPIFRKPTHDAFVFSFRDTFLVPPLFYYSHNAHKHPTHYYFCPVFTSCVPFHSRLLLECKYMSLDGFIQERGVFRGSPLITFLHVCAAFGLFTLAECTLGWAALFFSSVPLSSAGGWL